MISPNPTPTAIVELACADPALTARTHETLLDLTGAPGADGYPEVLVLGNTALRLRPSTPDGDAEADHRVYFTVGDVPAMQRLLTRRGFPVVESAVGVIGEMTPLGVAARESAGESRPAGDVTGMDHLVFTCDNRDRAVALFGGVFGLDFRLDQPIGDNTRQLFFRAGDLIVEVEIETPQGSDQMIKAGGEDAVGNVEARPHVLRADGRPFTRAEGHEAAAN